MQTKDNLVILTHKIHILITLTVFLKKCEKCKRCLHIGMKGVIEFLGHVSCPLQQSHIFGHSSTLHLCKYKLITTGELLSEIS